MKTCLLTGGSRGIGKATADLLRSKGWEVIAPTRAEFNMEKSYYGVTRKGLTNRAYDKPSALVFCHGEWYSKNLPEHKDKDYLYQYKTRVITPANILRVMLPVMVNNGCVIMVASTRGFIGGVDTGPYAAACAAQIAMMQGYAREYLGVRFNCVAPGLTNTDMGAEVIRTGGAKPGAAMQPPEAVAAEIVRLIESEDNGRIMRVVNSEVSEARWVWE